MKVEFLMSSIVLRYLLVGVLNTSVGFLIFSLAIYFTNGNAELSLAANIVVGVFFNYMSYGLAVFKSFSKFQFVKFLMSYLTIYLINLGAVNLMLDLGVNIFVAQFFNVLYLAPLSYFIFSKFVFTGGAD